MYYEVYIDGLLFINFIMNLFCLELVNRICIRTATRGKILLGAAIGAVWYLFPFLLTGPGWLKIMVLFPVGAVCMLCVVFRFDSMGAFCRVFLLLLSVSFALGGALQFLVKVSGAQEDVSLGIWGIFGAAVLAFAGGLHLIRQEQTEQFCRVELVGKGARITVRALIDSGNGLVEPLSGKPVCVVDHEVFQSLWQNGRPEGFRAIPYHSVGKENGILYGYPIPQMIVHNRGLVIDCRDIYIGVSPEALASEGGYRMLLHPQLLKKR